MESLFLLIPISLVIIGIAVWLFFRMSDSGQFDDMTGPAHAILMDDDRPAPQAPADPESKLRPPPED
ncbi:MAG TPA: cbb3-type cytochrome oxidase assembly protein CcoS [Quisquiliibacterium sp.]|nr:cbb3-type cytochrome oxidase assembly protein CcoS [Quisquiliibacterium sp.]